MSLLQFRFLTVGIVGAERLVNAKCVVITARYTNSVDM